MEAPGQPLFPNKRRSWQQSTETCGKATEGWCITELPVPFQHPGVAVETQLAFWLLGTGIQR